MKNIVNWKFKYILIVFFVVSLVLVIYLFFSTKKIDFKLENIKPTPTIVSTTTTTTTTYTLQGKVSLITGNCMPTIGSNNNCKHTFISRNIFIRDPISKNLIKKITSDNNGFYQVDLPLGTYSIFVEDNKKEYCNSFDGQGNACQVVIKPEINYYDIKINQAVW